MYSYVYSSARARYMVITFEWYSNSWRHHCLLVHCHTKMSSSERLQVTIFFASLTFIKVAEETQMAYLDDFYALYLCCKSDFYSKPSWRLVKPVYAKNSIWTNLSNIRTNLDCHNCIMSQEDKRTLCATSHPLREGKGPQVLSSITATISSWWPSNNYVHLAMSLINELGSRIRAEAGEPCSLHFLLQGLRVAVLCDHAATVTCTSSSKTMYNYNTILWYSSNLASKYIHLK